MRQHSVTWPRLFTPLALASLLILLFAATMTAQQGGGAPGSPVTDPNDPINQEKTNKADMRNREWMMGNSRKPIRRVGFGPEAAALPQISEDFEKIQKVDKELMTAVFANNLLDQNQIVKATTDIKKRAARLIANLAYPQPAEESETIAPDQKRMDMRLALAKLDGAIVSFVTNPIFQTNKQVLNTELATKVSTDLRTVMKLSDWIRHEAQASRKIQAAP